MQQSPYVHHAPGILADMERQRQEHEAQHQSGENGLGVKKVYVYRTDTGGVLFSSTKLGEQGTDISMEEATPQAPVVESAEPKATVVDNQRLSQQGTEQPRMHKGPLHFMHFVLLLAVFLFLDSIGPMLTDILTPMAIITITPNVRSISVQSTARLGKLLEPITVSESQTVPTTGHGHQDAERATGTVTFYNGLFTRQFVAQGTVFTGSDGVSLITTQPAYIQAGNPTVGYGTASVAAQAVQVGASGNIAAEDISVTINNGLLVKNSQFRGGQDERDYKVVTKSDRDSAAKSLQAKVSASMTAALVQQLTSTEQFQKVPCTPTVAVDHGIGQEATTVTVTVSETCTAIAYDTHLLTVQATHLLTRQTVKQFGQRYTLYGNVHVTITKATVHQQTIMLSFVSRAIYAYQFDTNMQRRIKTLIAGKQRLTALHQLGGFPGIQHASISGFSGNQSLPDESHIHLLIIFPAF